MEFLEVPIFDDDIFKMGVRFAFNIFFLILITRLAIYPNQRGGRDFTFTVVLMNITVFFICFTMKKLDLGLGMALGLFAIFGVLRYRTDAIRTKDMTYLFIAIGLAVINALSNKQTSYAELVTVNSVIFCATMLKERIVSRGQLVKQTIKYDSLNNLGVGARDKLIAELNQRTGLDIARVRVRNIDLRSSTATLWVWYSDPTTNGNGDTNGFADEEEEDGDE